MKPLRVVSTAILSILLLASAASCNAQKNEQQQDHGKPKQAEATRKNKQPDRSKSHPVPPARTQQREEPKRTTQMVRSNQQRASQEVQAQGVWQQHRAKNFASQRRSWKQRGGYTGYRIPNDYYARSFGPRHTFRVLNMPFMEMDRHPRFQYDGYWFTVLDPYPEYWDTDWYMNDDVYVDYSGDGYYLYDSKYPGRPGIAIDITF